MESCLNSEILDEILAQSVVNMICPAKIFLNVDIKYFLTSLILLPSMQMFKGRVFLFCVEFLQSYM